MVWLCARPMWSGLLGAARSARSASPSIGRPRRTVLDPRNLVHRSLHVSAPYYKVSASASASSRPPRAKTRTRSSSEPSPTTATAAEETESSVARGTRYELLCRAVLHEMFGMELERTGGAGDRGIDLRGWWSPPSLTTAQQATPDRIRIVAQCKCQDEGGKKMGPVLVREMEGVVFRASLPPSSLSVPPTEANEDGEEAPLAGIILSSSGFSKQALLQVRSSSVPLAAMHVLSEPLPPSTSGSGDETDSAGKVDRCVSIVWSDRFGSSTHGLLDGGMEVRWVRSLGRRGGGGEMEELGRPVIYRGGSPLRLPSPAGL